MGEHLNEIESGYVLNSDDIDLHRLWNHYFGSTENHAVTLLDISSGSRLTPDYGFLELANKFWLSSLAIFFTGISDGFSNNETAYTEPWLFTARHAFELFIKGFTFYSVYCKNLTTDEFAITDEDKDLLNRVIKPIHNLEILYIDYKSTLLQASSDWSKSTKFEKMVTKDFLLSEISVKILFELTKDDENATRYRYPIIGKFPVYTFQQNNWSHDPSKIHEQSGLSMQAGQYMDPKQIFNSLLRIHDEFHSIQSCFESLQINVTNWQQTSLEKIFMKQEPDTEGE